MAHENTDCGAGAESCGEPRASDSMRTFGAFVQALREHAGLSREEFAALVHFSKHTVASVELGRRMPDRGFVERTVYPAVPLHVEYELTELGRSVAQPLAQLRGWVEDHMDEIA